MLRALLIAAALLPAPAVAAETLVAARTIRAQTAIEPGDLAFGTEAVPGALADPAQAIGMEARAVIYAGRPIRPGDLAPAAVVERNAVVPIAFRRGPLTILAEGRVLTRGAAGEVVRVMNLASRTTVQGVITPAGRIEVIGSHPGTLDPDSAGPAGGGEN